MKDRTVVVGAAAVAALALSTGLVFGGAAGAFGPGGPVVTPPALTSTLTVDSIAGIEPAALYSTVAIPTVVIPPTPTWRIADEAITPRNQPLVVTTTETTTTVSSTSSPETTTATPAPKSSAVTTTKTAPAVVIGIAPPIVDISPPRVG